MNSKAIKRQLLAAIAMVLVAALALGSSTYAWFVASGTVTAKGMHVQAQSEGGLAISFKGQAWGTVATADQLTAKPLYPISSADLTNWYHATASDTSKFDADPASRENYTDLIIDPSTSDFKEDNSYVLMKEFEIRSTSSDKPSKGLYVSDVSVDAANQTMSTALRVGVYYKPTNGSAVYKIFGPVKLTGQGTSGTFNTPSDGYTVYNDSNASAGIVNLASATVGSATLINSSTPISATESVTVKIFIWFEGEDHNLFSKNFYNEDLSVNVKFTSISSLSEASIDLSSATVSGTTVQVGNATYNEISGATYGGSKLYTIGSSLTSSSQIFTITGETVTEVTSQCKLPTASSGG